MPTTNPPTSVRSLSDLRSLFPAAGNHRQRQTAEAHGHGPFVPCAMCGATFRYSLAVARVIDAEAGFAGFTHPVGTCDPKAVTAWQARVALQGEINATMDEVRRMRAGQARARAGVSVADT